MPSSRVSSHGVILLVVSLIQQPETDAALLCVQGGSSRGRGEERSPIESGESHCFMVCRLTSAHTYTHACLRRCLLLQLLVQESCVEERQVLCCLRVCQDCQTGTYLLNSGAEKHQAHVCLTALHSQVCERKAGWRLKHRLQVHVYCYEFMI